MIRINPTKIILAGDETRAEEFLGAARSQMNILIQDMSFQKLSQSVRRVKLYKDVFIECRKIFNYQECSIYIIPAPTPTPTPTATLEGSLIIVVSTQSGDEAFAWDIAADTALVEVTSREAVFERLTDLNISAPTAMLPSGYVETFETVGDPVFPPHRWVWQPPMELPEAFVVNVYYDVVSGEGFIPYPYSADFKYSMHEPYDNEIDVTTRFPYIENPYPEEEGEEGEDFKAAYILQWYVVDAPIWYEYTLGHRVFDPEIADQTLDPALTYPRDVIEYTNLVVDASWDTSVIVPGSVPPVAYDPDYKSFLSSGVAVVGSGAAVFEFFGSCDGWDFEDDTGFTGSYDSDLHLFVKQTEVLVDQALKCADLVNEYRVSLGLKELAVNLNLVAAAERHSADIGPAGVTGHIGTDGSTTEERIDDAGYMLYADVATHIQLGENIAYNYTASDAFAAWLGSSQHRANIEYSDFDEMGVGVALRPDGRYVWTQTFGDRQGTWPGFGPVKIGLKTYLDANFTFAGIGDETHVPLFYLAQKAEEI